MRRRSRTLLRALALLVPVMVGPLAHDASGTVQDREPALGFDRDRGFRAELVGLRFTERVEGSNRDIFVNEDRLDDYRIGVAIIRIDKPAGQEFTLACADVTLHYYHSGDTGEVTACRGLSSFSTVLETDRELELQPANSGPGFLKKTTLSAATAASTVYIEAMFSSMEHSTREAWIAIGHVDAAAPLVSAGWERKAGSTTCTSTSSIDLGSEENGSWSSSCPSANRSGRNARFFTFSLSSTTTVEIDLESGEDTYLFLLRGSGTTGDVITSDDDGGDGTDSRITRRLEAGTYTIEATTYDEGATGSFTLRLDPEEEE